MLSTRNPSRRRMTRTAGIALAAIVALPGVAVANHTDNCPNGQSPCSEFDPQLQVSGPEVPFTGVPNGLTLRWGQQRHQKPVIDVTWFIPQGWKFAPNLVSPGVIARDDDDPNPPAGNPGDLATQCTDLYARDWNHEDDQAAYLGSVVADPDEDGGFRVVSQTAENLFGGVGMSIQNFFFGSTSRSKIPYGFSPGSRDDGPPFFDATSRDPSVAFLNWDKATQTATLCMYLYANDTRVDDVLDSDVAIPLSDDHERARQAIIPIELKRVPADDPLAADFGWTIHWSLEDYYAIDLVRSFDTSVIDVLFQLPSITPGNFNVDDFGNNTGVVFSRSPSTPGTYEIRAEFRTCAAGMQTDTSIQQACIGNALSAPVVRSQFFTLTPPPDQIRHEFARITGPQTPAMCFNSDFCPLGLVLNSDNFDVTWEPPPTAPGVEILGYAVVVAEPQSQKTRHFRRVVTNPDFSEYDGFDPDACSEVEIPPEEEDGEPTFKTVCSTNIEFPLTSTDGSTILTGSSKYHVALITIFASGHRTDGLCDAGATDDGRGTQCDVNAKPIAIQEPGISQWQVLIRPERWLAFVETYDDTEFEPREAFFNRLLLVSFGRQEAEMIVWRNPDQVISLRGTSQAIIGSDQAGGIVHVQGTSLAGPTQNWAITALVDLTVLGGAVGSFAQWDLADVNLNTPSNNKAQVISDAGCILLDDFTFGLWSIFFGIDDDCPFFIMGQVS